jgi:hypothetical protein
MTFRRTPNPYHTLSPRNRLVAERERLAAEERRLAKQIDDLRSRQDDLSNALHTPNPTLADVANMMDAERAQRPVDPSKIAKMVIEAGEMARGRVPPQLPPRGSLARLTQWAHFWRAPVVNGRNQSCER